MRFGGVAVHFARINKFRLDMKRNGEVVSDAYLLRRTTLAVSGKHKALKDAVKEMCKIAGASGVPTLFADAKDNLLDTFQFEIPNHHPISGVREAVVTNSTLHHLSHGEHTVINISWGVLPVTVRVTQPRVTITPPG